MDNLRLDTLYTIRRKTSYDAPVQATSVTILKICHQCTPRYMGGFSAQRYRYVSRIAMSVFA